MNGWMDGWVDSYTYTEDCAARYDQRIVQQGMM